MGYSISHTSRMPRSNEVNGVDYHFVDKRTFKSMIEKRAFVEWAEVYNDLYGTSFSSLNEQVDQGLDILSDLDNQGAKNIKKHMKESILVYILPPSQKVLEKRLKERGTDDDGTIDIRITRALREMKECVLFDYIIINDHVDGAVKNLEAVIISERCRNARMLPRISDIVELNLGASPQLE